MDVKARSSSGPNMVSTEEEDLKRGPWTIEEDFKLINYISIHGKGRWNSLAQSADTICGFGMKFIDDCFSINHEKKTETKEFKDTMRYLWMPRLVERIQAATTTTNTASTSAATTSNASIEQMMLPNLSYYTPDNASTTASSDSIGTQVSPISDSIDYYNGVSTNYNPNQDYLQANHESLISPIGSYCNNGDGMDFGLMELNHHWASDGDGDGSHNLLNAEDFFFLQHQFNFNM
ncbi:hypothetical protein GOBAR_DD32375 [Gossypium barbadense]|nr:hypothetical protein GOBAR_DD32375 [Gossypium barbadense]